MDKRYYALDNIKGFLIFCVVYGHLIEFLPYEHSNFVYLLIYSFHIPVFVFVSGIFASKTYSPAKILTNYIYPYILYQTLYILYFRRLVDPETQFQFLTPIWLLWYLMALILWNIAIHYVTLNVTTLWHKLFTVALAFGIAIWTGYQNHIGYALSLSRAVCFFPFFLMGYYCKDYISQLFSNEQKAGIITWGLRFVSLLLGGGVLYYLYSRQPYLKWHWFYQSHPYASGQYNAHTRIVLFGCAGILLIVICLFAPKKKIPILTYVGQHTMPVFVLHGFALKYLQVHPIEIVTKQPAISGLLVTLSIVLILSSKPVQILFDLLSIKNLMFLYQKIENSLSCALSHFRRSA